MPRADDFAVLVGIQEYPNVPVSNLAGPARDVEHFEKWLVDPNGGDVDPNNVRKLVTQKPKPNVPRTSFRLRVATSTMPCARSSCRPETS